MKKVTANEEKKKDGRMGKAPLPQRHGQVIDPDVIHPQKLPTFVAPAIIKRRKEEKKALKKQRVEESRGQLNTGIFYERLPESVTQGPVSTILTSTGDDIVRKLAGPALGDSALFALANLKTSNYAAEKMTSQRKPKHPPRLSVLKSTPMKYADFQRLSKLWTEYFTELIGPSAQINPDQLALKVLKADYHGSFLQGTNQFKLE
eukprot:TRINITY_DN4549_c0_g1_i2.p1 TRINITY_DN4549_c0_g1~~TRINITY_DN4549_c0_g1_i2.p1  ORF type:complete len:239 (+),score=35.54 TRINITY_DN4549_c0_g1_i2:106-717(+)